MQIEHERAERPFHPCQGPLQHHEAGTGNTRCRLEIHQAEGLAQFEMLLGFEGEFAGRAHAAHLDVAVLVRPIGHIRARQVGDDLQQLLQLGLKSAALVLALGQHVLQRGNLGHQLGGERIIFGGLRLADLLGRRIAPRLSILQGCDRGAPGLVQLDESGTHGYQPAPRKGVVEGLRVVADGFDVVHGRPLWGSHVDPDPIGRAGAIGPHG